MKILILGGTGRTGKWLITEALNRGHMVHALVRDKQRIPLKSGLLIPFEGNPANKDDLANAILGCDSILNALNISRQSEFPWSRLITPENFLSTVTGNVIDLCQKRDIDRYIVITAAGVGSSAHEIPGWFRWLIRHSNIGTIYKDHEKQEALLRMTSLHWTVVRPVGLTDKTVDKDIMISFEGRPKPGMTISRKNVARFMIDVLERKKYIHQTPTISEK